MHIPEPFQNDIFREFQAAGVEAVSLEFNPECCILRLKLPRGVQKEPIEAEDNSKIWREMTEEQRQILKEKYSANWNLVAAAYARVFKVHFPEMDRTPRVNKVAYCYVVEVTFKPKMETTA